jgi:uncharacterized damage-inducible protein DinB
MNVAQNFIERSRAYLTDEYRIDALPPDALWWRPNEQSNSVGNLLLHLEGNLRQWIIAGIGGTPDTRNRAGEFAAQEGASKEELLAKLEKALGEADSVLANLKPDRLGERLEIQARNVTLLDAVYQVVQHFALHLGQIILVAKAQVPGAVQFYEDAGGKARPLWRE